jgi:hypothetical protein
VRTARPPTREARRPWDVQVKIGLRTLLLVAAATFVALFVLIDMPRIKAAVLSVLIPGQAATTDQLCERITITISRWYVPQWIGTASRGRGASYCSLRLRAAEVLTALGRCQLAARGGQSALCKLE